MKGKKLHIAEFQAGVSGAPLKQGSMSWADEADLTESGGASADCAPPCSLPALQILTYEHRRSFAYAAIQQIIHQCTQGDMLHVLAQLDACSTVAAIVQPASVGMHPQVLAVNTG